MKWFKKWIYRMYSQGRDIYEEEEIDVVASHDTPRLKNALRGMSRHTAGTPIGTNSPNTHCINFQIYPATGGYVAEINFYDEKSDNNVRSLHVIPSTDLSELGSNISKIITLEMLKR